jgi:hypothetical protein
MAAPNRSPERGSERSESRHTCHSHRLRRRRYIYLRKASDVPGMHDYTGFDNRERHVHRRHQRRGDEQAPQQEQTEQGGRTWNSGKEIPR